MRADEFVTALAAANPTVEDYVNIGLTEKEAKSLCSGYVCPKRATPLGIAESNELFALMNRWETRKVEIGMVCLASAPVKHAEGMKVGVVETDPLVIHPTNELVVHEQRVPTHVLWATAASAEQFLDAMAFAAKFLGDRSIEKIAFEDLKAARAAAKKCAKLAGGETYYDFYAMLLSAEE
jgi:hypothetical protein